MFYIVPTINTVLTECTETSGCLKRKKAEHKPVNLDLNSLVKIDNDEGFLTGINDLNPYLICNIEQKSPDYPIGRFCEYCDVKTVFPEATEPQIESTLNKRMGFNSTNLLSHNDIRVIVFKQIFKAATERTYPLPTSKLNDQNFDLTLCSPWPSKKEPESVTKSKREPEKGKIYTNIQATHKVADDFVVEQETEDGEKFGYVTSPVLIKATVAFPQICEGEIWTIGWIQGLTKGLMGCYYEQNERFVEKHV